MTISSTTHMLNVLGCSASNATTGKRAVEANSETTDFSEKKIQLTPSSAPSMSNVLTHCLGSKHGQDNTPLK